MAAMEARPPNGPRLPPPAHHRHRKAGRRRASRMTGDTWLPIKLYSDRGDIEFGPSTNARFLAWRVAQNLDGGRLMGRLPCPNGYYLTLGEWLCKAAVANRLHRRKLIPHDLLGGGKFGQRG